MNKVLLVLFVCAFSVSAIACGGNKDKEEDKKFTEISTPV